MTNKSAKEIQARIRLDAVRDAAGKRKAKYRHIVRVCNTGCRSRRSSMIVDALHDAVLARGIEKEVLIQPTGCHGFCEFGPVMVVEPQGFFYGKVTAADVPEIVSETLIDGNPVKRLLWTDPDSGREVLLERDIPFYHRQQKLVSRKCGSIDPTSIEDYLAEGGYRALEKALFEMRPQEVIEQVESSGLRGRGGGGFPVGRKWRSCRQAEGLVKYVIANGDEGDPGAFMDRCLMEGDPHSILEGMIIGAYAIGAHEGFLYVRDEYPLAVEHLSIAIGQAEQHGLLGEEILGSQFNFTVSINRGAGAFVCGESTALMNSLEGKMGEPRAKYIHTVESGLWGRPSNLNNVETWANVPLIINEGPQWFRDIGTNGSKGTKIFSVVGKVNNPGLVEVPMGTTLREIIFDIGGGITPGSQFKAVQTGGPSGGCLPASRLDMSVDFDLLSDAGSMMGSGGMIVMDERTCMVDLARYYIGFLISESCGKCVPCREGLAQMNEILTGICKGQAHEQDIDTLQELALFMRDASLCGLGQTAPNPVLSTLRYFRSEYEACASASVGRTRCG
ncbi:MAG: NADH-ubiquinone oxidoreductase-F iron-sulfur binding region domain-containing protein [Deltaproteobacteria bacterium]